MFLHVCCENDSCVHFKDGGCGRDLISIETRTTTEFFGGRRISYPVCANYREAGENDADGTAALG